MCELDIIFNFEKAYFILDEFLMGGEVQDTSKKSVLKAIEQADLLQEVGAAWREGGGGRLLCCTNCQWLQEEEKEQPPPPAPWLLHAMSHRRQAGRQALFSRSHNRSGCG